MRYPFTTIVLLCLIALGACNSSQRNEEALAGKRWTIEEANAWAAKYGWLRGSNFNPSTAINQLETWQAGSFDPETIDRELMWASEIGLNCMRVYLHHVAWEVDQKGFIERMERYLELADGRGISTIFVFFDDCWNPVYKAGKQAEPKPGIHNSGWVRDPGDLYYEDSSLVVLLEEYFKDVMNHFRDDERIALWDLYNEPGNSGYGNKSKDLLQKAFKWGREVDPVQPLSVGLWNKGLVELNAFQLENSDVITYHNYSGPADHKMAIDSLKLYGRPLVCTEYMARKFKSTFQSIMPMLAEENIGAINWGLVAGKSNTKYAWGDPIPDGSDPKLWFHEIFRPDGTPYKQEEVDVIMKLTGVK